MGDCAAGQDLLSNWCLRAFLTCLIMQVHAALMLFEASSLSFHQLDAPYAKQSRGSCMHAKAQHGLTGLQ